MKTYKAHLIFRIQCEGITTEQYEEQWRLVLAEEYNEALGLARKEALKEESAFKDRLGRMVTWELVAVKSLDEFEIEQGALMHSVIREIVPVTEPFRDFQPMPA